MVKLSIILPSRDERFLIPTIHDIFTHARGEIEVIAVLDSDKWPEGWKEVTDKYVNLHTIHNGKSIGMRGSINAGVASAISRGAKFIAKFDAHCSFSEGFDEVLKAECDKDWIVVPRRGRLDPENWCATETHKPDIDYHYLSFPNDPADFGGAGLNGKVWAERAITRKDILLDEEMSSQGSGWFMHADYFTQLDLMDEANYGPFWNEFQELGLKCWLSGGKVMVNKKARYLHLHKGKKYGRGYKLQESALTQGRDYTMKWIYNEAWTKQTLPFKWLIEHFWEQSNGIPTWPDNWEEILYAKRKPRAVAGLAGNSIDNASVANNDAGNISGLPIGNPPPSLRIHSARYGIANPDPPFQWGQNSIDVLDRLRSLVKHNSLDVVVSNSTLTPGENPFRGKKKVLVLTYSIDGGEQVTVERAEKDWLIIGPVKTEHDQDFQEFKQRDEVLVKAYMDQLDREYRANPVAMSDPPQTPAALNDYLIRKFQISPHRLRGPMPIELRDFHRNDLAQLFAELGFKRGAEIGVAEGHYSEILLKANPELELLLVDPWHHYSDNPQGKSKEKHEFAYVETIRKTMGYQHVKIAMQYSMDAVRDVEHKSLDFCYIDGHHSFDYVMQDLIEWSKRVRSGGIVSGDDLFTLDEKRWGARPVEAVQAYTNAHRIGLWFTCDAPRSYDYFWVKP